MVGLDQFFVNMFIGANGTSKTATGANIVTNIVFGVQNGYFEHPLFQEFPYFKRGRIISDPTTIKEKIIPELEKWFPANEAKKIPQANFETAKEGKNYVCKIRTKNDWVIDIMSTEQDAKEFESVDLGFVWIDEPMPKDKFLATLARGRLGMILFWTFTPLTYSAWIKNWMDEHPVESDYIEAEMEDNCFGEFVEYLTNKGWKLLKDASNTDIAATVNLKNMDIEFQQVIKTISKQYSGDMLELYGGILSTPEHRIVGKFDGKQDFEIREAKDLYRGVRMLGHVRNGYKSSTNNFTYSKRFNIYDWAEFMGWYLSEGCVTGVKGGKDKNYRIYISQNEGKNREEIKELLTKMGISYKNRKGDVGFSDKDIHKQLLPLGSSSEKYIPDYIFEYPRDVQKLFWETLIKGDGNRNRYFTTSKKLANDLQRLLTLMGHRSSLSVQKQSKGGYASKKILYRVYRMQNRQIYINHKLKPQYYDGLVSCVSVPNRTIIVRGKENKPLIVGNCKIHGVRGHFEHKNIKRIADSFPEDEKEARVFGKFGHLIGRVHKKFSRKIHVVKPFPLNERDWTTYKAIDPHPREPDHVLYMSVNKKGTKVITAELISGGLISDLYERMKSLESKMNFRIEDRIIDPSAYVDDQHRKEKTIGSQLYDLGESYIKGSKDLMAGIDRTDQALDYELKLGNMLRAPELLVFDTCTVFIKQIEEYVWSEYKGAMADEKKRKATPKDVGDHQPENLHRLLLHEPKFVNYSVRKSTALLQPENDEFDPY